MLDKLITRFSPKGPKVTYLNPMKLLALPGWERMRHFLETVGDEPIVQTWLGPRLQWTVNDADIVRHVLQDNYKNYPKSDSYKEVEYFLGKGLLTSSGEFWLRQRRLMQPLFHHRYIESFARDMAEEIAALVERWDAHAASGQPFDLAEDMTRLTLGVVGRALFGTKLDAGAHEVGRALQHVLAITDERLATPFNWPHAVPTPRNLRFRRALAVLDAHVNAIIEGRRKGKGERSDLLQLLLDARDESGQGMSDTQLRDEAMTLILAGHETTANALTWAFYLLTKHPSAERALQQELDATLSDAPPSFADLRKLAQPARIFQETMRLFPPIWVVERQAAADDRIGDLHVPAGTRMTIAPFIMHYNRRYWDQPQGFDPERFAPAAAEGRHKFAYIPFAAGPRVCIGKDFAMVEGQLALAALAQRFRIELVPAAHVEPSPQLTLRLKHGLWVRAARRTRAVH
jgi:cytochrome P450